MARFKPSRSSQRAGKTPASSAFAPIPRQSFYQHLQTHGVQSAQFLQVGGVMRRALLATLVLVALSAQSQVKRVDPGAGMGPPPGTRDLQLPPDRQSAARPTGPMVDVVQLQKDAQEMAKLSASINTDMDGVNKG